MKITNSDAAEKAAALRKLAQSSDTVLSATLGYRIMQNIHALDAALAPYHETRNAIIQRFAHGAQVIEQKTDPEAFTACRKELAELDALEIDVPMQMVKLAQLDGVNLPLSAMYALDIMIEQEA